jgi:hypothetical protein
MSKFSELVERVKEQYNVYNGMIEQDFGFTSLMIELNEDE